MEKVTLSLGGELKEKFKEMAKKEYSDMSKLLRKWINENWNKKYGEKREND